MGLFVFSEELPSILELTTDDPDRAAEIVSNWMTSGHILRFPAMPPNKGVGLVNCGFLRQVLVLVDNPRPDKPPLLVESHPD
jgi:hypothetical protein